MRGHPAHPRRPTRAGHPADTPELLDVLDARPTTKTWKTRGRPAEKDLAGLRDRALLLVGFFAALRLSELAALDVDQIAEHPNGLVLALPRSKTDQHGLAAELVVLPRAGHPGRCPVTALGTWLDAAAITDGLALRAVSEGIRALPCGLNPGIDQRPRAGARSPGPGSTPAPTARTRCGSGSSRSPTCGAHRTEPSPTRPDTVPWPPSAPTSASTRPGPITPPPCWACRSTHPAGPAASLNRMPTQDEPSASATRPSDDRWLWRPRRTRG